MSAMKSVHDQLKKVRKPRVHITYDVETEGAEVKKELPFVVGVMGDFTAQSTTNQKSLKDRKFIQIDGDSFDEVMTKMSPELNFKVKNTLKDDDSELAVNLHFKEMDDFEPAKIAEQIAPLKQLIAVRTELSDLLSKADRSDKLESILENVLNNNDDLKKLSEELGIKGDDAAQEEAKKETE